MLPERPSRWQTAALVRLLQAVRLEEGPDAVHDLPVALRPEHHPVVRMGPVLLVLRAEPCRQLLGGYRSVGSVEARADDEARHVRQAGRVHGHAREHVRAGASGLPGLLAQQVLDPQDVVERHVAVLALELLREGVPADDRVAYGRAVIGWE